MGPPAGRPAPQGRAGAEKAQIRARTMRRLGVGTRRAGTCVWGTCVCVWGGDVPDGQIDVDVDGGEDILPARRAAVK